MKPQTPSARSVSSLQWTQSACSTARDAIQWVDEAAGRGAGEILITSMDRDGTGSGYDLELTAAVAAAVPVPVIASGGAGGPEDLRLALTEGRADAALAATIFHFDASPIPETKRYLRHHGVEVRL
jgi:imidazole glycerol-phosphate synthase subunit HisF